MTTCTLTPGKTYNSPAASSTSTTTPGANCGSALSAPADGSINSTSFDHGTIVEYDCNNNNTHSLVVINSIESKYTRKCIDGVWSGYDPMCATLRSETIGQPGISIGTGGNNKASLEVKIADKAGLQTFLFQHDPIALETKYVF